MSVYRIWIDDGKHTEAEHGEDVEAEVASEAVHTYAFNLYSYLQHVDPGQVLVRYPNGGSVVRWSMRSRVSFDVEALEVVEDRGDGA